MTHQKIVKHFGVYGVATKNDKLLCILKNAGPYKNRYDLPGGSQEIGEGLTDTLKREVLEETGISIKQYNNNRVYDVFVKENDKDFTVHHIFVLFDISLENKSTKEIPLLVNDGLNDSEGVRWVTLSNLTEDNSSPLILKLKDEINNKKQAMKKSTYLEWKTIEKK